MTFQWKSVSCQYLRKLMMRFEAGPEKVGGVPWPRCPDGGALQAYRCSAGKWTIAFGVRWHPDNRPVVEGDTITADQVWEYTDAAVARVEADIRTVVTIDMTPYQYGGIVFWVYNLGIGALKKTVDGETQLLAKINAGRWLDVATAMGVFVYATTTHKDGNTWKRAMFGIFVRRAAEGCTLMGHDFEFACDTERLALPTRTDWQPNWVNPENGARGRYYDAVLEGKTPFLNVYRDAKAYPIEAPELILTTKAEPAQSVAQGKAGQPVQLPNPAPAAPAPKPPPAAPASSSVAAGPAPSVGASPPKAAPVPVPAKPPALPTSVGTKPPSPNTKMPEHVPYRIDPNAGLKPMEETERFIGAALMLFGTFARVIMANGAALSGVTGVVVVAILDMMKSPTNLAILVSVIALGVTAVGWFIGFILDKLGLKIKKRGEATSSQGMY